MLDGPQKNDEGQPAQPTIVEAENEGEDAEEEEEGPHVQSWQETAKVGWCASRGGT